MSSQLLERPPLVPPQRHLPSAHVAYLLMLGSSLSFACMTTCGHSLSGRCDWRIVAIARSFLAFAFTFAIARQGGVPLVFWKPKTLWMRSCVGSFSMLMTFYAMDRLQISTLLTLTNTFPLWVTLLAWPILRERPSAAFGLALLSGIAGVVLIENPQAGAIRPATLAALGASFCTAVVMLGLHRLRRVESLAIVVHFSGFATVVCVGYAALTAMRGETLDLGPLVRWDVIGLLLGVGVFATLGQILMTRAFRIGSPQRLAVVGLAQVVFAMGIESVIWPHVIDARTIVGTVLVLAPVAWLLGRRRGK